MGKPWFVFVYGPPLLQFAFNNVGLERTIETTRRLGMGAKYRTKAGIVADLLSAALEAGGDGGGVGITRIIQSGNVSCPKATAMLEKLVGGGLLRANGSSRARYTITPNGIRYLNAYRDFEDLAHSYGLRV
jgi:predicted transcriptional regulator